MCLFSLHLVAGGQIIERSGDRILKPSSLFVGVATVAITLASSTSQARSDASAELYDYLVQDVCVDTQGDPIKGDPAVCENTRNIKLGEPSPYLLTDWDTVTGISYAAWNSIPVRGEDGETRVIVSRNMDTRFDADFTFSFSARSDSFDLIDLTHGPYASIIRTSDGGCLDQLFAPRLARELNRATRFNRRRASGKDALNSPRARAGGWVLFPLSTPPSDWPQTASIKNRNTRTPLQRESGCNAGGSTGATFWNAPMNYTYEGNEDGKRKTLLSIRSDHFGSHRLSSRGNALERFYFTKEYGMTRWESWIPRKRCIAEEARVPEGALRSQCFPEREDMASSRGPELNLRARCKDMIVSSTGHPDVERWGDQDWVRVDCRDLTRYLELNEPVLMLDKRMAQINGVDDIDY